MSDKPEGQKSIEDITDQPKEQRFSDLASEVWNNTIEQVHAGLKACLNPLQDVELQKKPSEIARIHSILQCSTERLSELLRLQKEVEKFRQKLDGTAPHQSVPNPLHEHISDS